MAREWGIEVASVADGATRSFLDLGDIKCLVQMNDYCQLGGTLLTTDPNAAELDVCSRMIRAYVDGILRFQGQIAQPLEAGAETTNLLAADPWFFAKARQVQSTNHDGSPFKFTNADAGAVLWSLVDQQNVRQKLYVKQGTIVPSVKMSQTYDTGQSVADAADAIAAMEGGPYFRLDPIAWEPTALSDLNVSPIAGRDLRDSVRFEFGDDTLGNLDDDFQVQVVIPSTAILATGGTDANGSQLVSYKVAAQSVLDEYGLNEVQLSFPDVTDQAHLDALALAHVQTKPTKTYTVNTLPTGGKAEVPLLWDDFDRGDIVALVLRYGWLDVDVAVQVNACQVEVDDESQEEKITGLVLQEIN